MNHSAVVFLCLALLTGCQASGIRSYWNDVPLLEKDLSVSEDRFARFAEQAVSVPEDEAFAAMDALFDKLKQDTVAYYIYSEWMDGAFYSPLSPCRNAAFYDKAVDRLVTDGILSTDECEPFLRRREWILYNREGAKATVPGLSDIDTRTLVLVLDLSCPSCREALQKLAEEPQWNDAKKLAVCLGYGPQPSVPGWDYLFPENGDVVFDIHMSPFYFVVAADGTVERGYALAL